MRTLNKGTRYNLETLVHQGWNGVETEGYNCWDYFEADGTYRGADQHGVEPVWSDLGDGDEIHEWYG